MAAFYRRCKAGQAPGYPRFKARDRWDSVEWPKDGDGCRWKPDTGRCTSRVSVTSRSTPTAPLRAGSRRSASSVKAAAGTWSCPATTYQPGRSRRPAARSAWMLAWPGSPPPATGRSSPTRRFSAPLPAELTAAQQALVQKKRGSANRRRARAKVAEVHRRIRNRRADFHHKTARALVRACDVIALENLNTAGMTRRPAPKPDPERPGAYLPNGAAAKAGLNKSILDAGWAQFANILIAKVEETGRRVIFVNPACTSIDCHLCGRRCTRPQQDTVICPVHGAMDADVNGARNICTRAGLGSGQARAA